MSGNPLFSPRNTSDAKTWQLMRNVNAKYNLSLASYDEFWAWSTDQIGKFWASVWEETDVIGERGQKVVDEKALPADNPHWFPGSRVNWAENALWCRSPDKIALIEAVEPTPDLDGPSFRKVTYAELYSSVADIVSALTEQGVTKGDRVASYSSNCIETAIVCLATAAIGALWVSAAADFGPDGVLERGAKLSGVASRYNGKRHPHIPKLEALLAGLNKRGLEAPKVVIIDATRGKASPADGESAWERWDDFLNRGRRSKAGRDHNGNIAWIRVDFNHPLWVMFSSGTTGTGSSCAMA
ncbi:hypothetical protein FRC10_000680 [Ceratobasidium sp. 414]|nr:hypothetical protein FRC10_000680 [Ceratobasidium sp. 414]